MTSVTSPPGGSRTSSSPQGWQAKPVVRLSTSTRRSTSAAPAPWLRTATWQVAVSPGRTVSGSATPETATPPLSASIVERFASTRPADAASASCFARLPPWARKAMVDPATAAFPARRS